MTRLAVAAVVGVAAIEIVDAALDGAAQQPDGLRLIDLVVGAKGGQLAAAVTQC